MAESKNKSIIDGELVLMAGIFTLFGLTLMTSFVIHEYEAGRPSLLLAAIAYGPMLGLNVMAYADYQNRRSKNS